jgi:hypothetical protein
MKNILKYESEPDDSASIVLMYEPRMEALFALCFNDFAQKYRIYDFEKMAKISPPGNSLERLIIAFGFDKIVITPEGNKISLNASLGSLFVLSHALFSDYLEAGLKLLEEIGFVINLSIRVDGAEVNLSGDSTGWDKTIKDTFYGG